MESFGQEVDLFGTRQTSHCLRCWGWMLWYRLGRGFVCTPFPARSAHRSSRESAPGWGPSIAKTSFWPGRVWFCDLIFLLSMGDSHQEGSPLTGSGHDLSSLLGVVEAVGVATEGAQLISSGLSTEVAETILQSRAPSMRKLYALKLRLSFIQLTLSHVSLKYSS